MRRRDTHRIDRVRVSEACVVVVQHAVGAAVAVGIARPLGEVRVVGLAVSVVPGPERDEVDVELVVAAVVVRAQVRLGDAEAHLPHLAGPDLLHHGERALDIVGDRVPIVVGGWHLVGRGRHVVDAHVRVASRRLFADVVAVALRIGVAVGRTSEQALRTAAGSAVQVAETHLQIPCEERERVRIARHAHDAKA